MRAETGNSRNSTDEVCTREKMLRMIGKRPFASRMDTKSKVLEKILLVSITAFIVQMGLSSCRGGQKRVDEGTSDIPINCSSVQPIGDNPKSGAAFRVLVLDFLGDSSSDCEKIEPSRHFVDDTVNSFLRKNRAQLQDSSVQLDIGRGRCFVESHTQAEETAKSWGADIVIWGLSRCGPKESGWMQVLDGDESGRKIAKEPLSPGDNESLSKHSFDARATMLVDSSSPSLSSDDGVAQKSYVERIEMRASNLSSLIRTSVGLGYIIGEIPSSANAFLERSISEIVKESRPSRQLIRAIVSSAYSLAAKQGTARESEEIARYALSLSPSDTQRALLHLTIGLGKLNCGKYEAAEQAIRKGLEFARETSLPQTKARIKLSFYLAQVFGATSRNEEAISRLKELEPEVEDVFGRSSEEYATVLNDRGLALLGVGDPQGAAKSFTEAKGIHESLQSRSDFQYAMVLGNLAIAHSQMREIEKAVSYYREKLKIHERLGRPIPEAYVQTITNLSVAYVRMGSFNQASKMLEESIEASKEISEAQDNRSFNAKITLATVLNFLGKCAESEALSKAVLNELSSLGDGFVDSRTRAGLALARAVSCQGRVDDARKEIERAKKSALDLDNFELYAATMMTSAEIRCLSGDCERAYVELKSIQKPLIELTSTTHALSIRLIYTLGKIRLRQGKFSEARKLCKQAYQLYRSEFPNLHPDTGASLACLGKAHYGLKQFQQARERLLAAIEVCTARDVVSSQWCQEARSLFSFTSTP